MSPVSSATKRSPRVRVATPAKARGDLVVVGCIEGIKPDLRGLELATPIPPALSRFRGEKGERLDLTTADGRAMLGLRGLGPGEDLRWSRLGSWLRDAVREAEERRIGSLVVSLPLHDQTAGADAAGRIGLELALAGYRFEQFLASSRKSSLRTVTLVPPPGEEASWKAGIAGVDTVAGGVRWSRDLGNTPPNVATPAWLASEARRLGRDLDLRVVVLADRELRRRKMGGLLAVGGGATHGPRLVRLRYGRRGPKVALVGKGVTFDSGGVSLKPAASMEEMKYDKCGACNVLGIVKSARELQLPVRISAYLPLAENMPGGGAYRPGDIIRCYGGKSVEIMNTDAEGRLILADALSWAAEERPDYLLEMSTLTGAAVVALGESVAALYSSDDGLAGALLEAAGAAGERLWRMPLWPEFVEEMKGNHADLKNAAGRWGGANTAAAFLSQFVEKVERWAHLDIAGPSYAKQDGRGQSATGFGVATVIQWLGAL